MAEKWNDSVNMTRVTAPSDEIRNSIKSEVTGGDPERWEPFQFVLSASSPGVITEEFGGSRQVEKKDDVTNPPETKAPNIEQIIFIAIYGALFLTAGVAMFFHAVEYEYDVDKTLLGEI